MMFGLVPYVLPRRAVLAAAASAATFSPVFTAPADADMLGNFALTESAILCGTAVLASTDSAILCARRVAGDGGRVFWATEGGL